MSIENQGSAPFLPPEAAAEIARLKERIAELERERDGAWAWAARMRAGERNLQVSDPAARLSWNAPPPSQAAREVANQRELLQGIIDTIPVMITIYDPALQRFRFNQEFRRVTGWTEEDMAVADPMALFYPDPACREKVRLYMQSLTAGWQDFLVTTKSGEQVESSWANIRLADQTQVGIGIDVRHRKRMEEELRRAKEAAEDASRAKSEFLANMSHEVRTPLTVVLASLEHLQAVPAGDERRALLQMADDAARRLLALVDDLLDISRIEARQLTVFREPFEVRLAVEKILEPFRLKAQAKGVRLYWEIDTLVPWLVVGDANRLGQVLTNLVGNAVKFTERGEVAVRVTWTGQGLLVRVRDTGIGIPADKHDQLFRPFSQLDSSRTRRFGGTGLGLALSRKLVELMGGEIGLTEEEGSGCEFFFSLPLTPLSTGDRDQAQRPGRPVQILVVEDDPMVRELVQLILRQRGWQVSLAENGRQAVAMAAAADYDLILMDLQMPEMDGVEATRQIRRQEEGRPRTPIIALTAHARREDREECLAGGMDGWLAKPVSMEQLYAIIEERLAAAGPLVCA